MQWYAPLIEKIEQTYSDLEIVSDGDDLGQDPAVRQALRRVLSRMTQGSCFACLLDERDSQQRAPS